jgi:hypothetical protein
MLPQAKCVCTLIISMWEELFAEELVGKDAGLGYAPYSSLHFKVNETVECMHVQVILLDNPLQEECKWDFYVLEPVQGCTEVKVFNVQAHVLGSLSAEYTVPHQF